MQRISTTQHQPIPTDIVIYARAVAEAARYPQRVGSVRRLVERDWDAHEKLRRTFTHPKHPGVLAWLALDGSVWLTRRLGRGTQTAPSVADLGFDLFGWDAPVVVSPTAIDLPVEGPGLPPLTELGARRRVVPPPDTPPWMYELDGVRCEFRITGSAKSNSRSAQYTATLVLGGPLEKYNEGNTKTARSEVLSGDQRHIASFPADTPGFVGRAAYVLHALLLQLGRDGIEPSGGRTGNFNQLGRLYRGAQTGNSAFRLALPTALGKRQYVACGYNVLPCTDVTFADVCARVGAG